MKQIFPIADTHSHTYFPALDKFRETAIKHAEEAGVCLQVQVGCDEVSSLAALELAKKHKNHYSSLGLHPTDVQNLGKPQAHRISGFENYKLQAHNLDELIAWFEKIFQENKDKIVAYGETGFDFYHADSPELRKQQEASFLRHIELADKYNRALIIHTRSAREETLHFLEKYKKMFYYSNNKEKMRGVIHCFTEDTDFAEIVTQKYGFFIGIGGIATYPKAESIRAAIKATPIEFLVTETDAPFLVPRLFKNRGRRTNESAFLTEVVELIADLKEMVVEDAAEMMLENARKLFNM